MNLAAALLMLAGAQASVLSDGATAFDDGDLDRAIELWQPALERGDPSGKVLFNLGNAWYRKGDIPRAIAHYRGAQRLRPRDGHVHHNLALARSELQGTPAPPKPSPTWSALLTAGELSVLGFVVTTLGAAAALAWKRRREWPAAAMSAALLVAGTVLSGMAFTARDAGRIVVVVDAPVAVRDAPRPDGGSRHTLEPGTELRVLSTFGEFHLVEDGRRRRGWVSTSSALLPGS